MDRLSESFPYLVNNVGVRMGEVATRLLERHGVTLPMYRVMAALRERGGQRLGELAELASVEPSTLSRLVGSMSAKQLVSRRRVDTNGRVVEINLTDRGSALTEELMQITAQHERIALRGFNAQHIARLKRDLAAIYANLEAFEQEVGTAEMRNAE